MEPAAERGGDIKIMEVGRKMTAAPFIAQRLRPLSHYNEMNLDQILWSERIEHSNENYLRHLPASMRLR